MVITRFAPSPTGPLHVGSARTALLNWLFAQHFQGQMLLRLDDTDTQRSREAYTHAILEDLTWLGLQWQGFVRQSDRRALYEQAIQRLKDQGDLYPCYETEEELQQARQAQLAQGLPPIYRRKPSVPPHPTRPAHWRFALPQEEVTWNDLVHGLSHYHTRHLSDPILVREDGMVGYLLASVIDDLDLSITHVIRGEDHLTNTAVQSCLFKALGGKSPAFGHFPLMRDEHGQKFSKRLHSLSISDLRKEGLLPMAFNHVLASLGTNQAPDPQLSLPEMAQRFCIQDYGCAAPRLHMDLLWSVNSQLIARFSLSEVHQLTEEAGNWLSEGLWDVLKDNLKSLSELAFWKDVCQGCIQPPSLSPEDTAFIGKALDHLPPTPWHGDRWDEWTQELRTLTGRKGKSLYHPLRLALTGQEQGPQLRDLFAYLDPGIIRQRLAFYTES